MALPKNIDGRKSYLVKGATLKKLIDRKIISTDGMMLVDVDNDGNSKIKLSKKFGRECWIVLNGGAVHAYIPIQIADT